MEAEEAPARCDSCQATSVVAAELLRARATLAEGVGPARPEPSASQPALEAIRTLELQDSDLAVEGPPPPPLEAMRTLELQDSDLTESPRAEPPPPPSALASEERALELDDEDLEPAAVPPPGPRRSTSTGPLQPEQAGQPLDDELDQLSLLGVRSVLDLRTEAEIDHGRIEAEHLGITHLHLPVLGRTWSPEKLDPAE
jgi:hypothetical protein